MTTGTFCFWFAYSASVCYFQCLKALITEDDKPVHLLAVDWQEMCQKSFIYVGNISNTETFVNVIVGVHNTMQIEFYMLLTICMVQSSVRTDK